MFQSKEQDRSTALAQDIKAIILRHLAGQDILPSELRDEEKFLDTISCDLLSFNSNMKSDSTRFGLVSRARRQAKRIESLYDVQHAITAKLEDELRSARERVEVMGTVCGLASLPPELLAHAFSFAIFGDPEPDIPCSFATLHLSHVCRRFRNAILSTPNLWSEVNAMAFTPEMELVRACLDRSQNAPLDVFLNLYTNEIDSKKSEISACDAVLFAILPHAHRWRTLHLTFHFTYDFVGSPGCLGALEGLQNIAAPNLEKITEMHSFGDCSSFGRAMHFFSSWKMPKLNRLSLTDCLPISIENLTTITRLDVHLINSTGKHALSLANLVGMLSRATSLCHLRVNLDRLEVLEALQGFGQVVSLENVQQLEFSCCLGDVAYVDDQRTIILQSFFSALIFPNTITLHFQCINSNYIALDIGRPIILRSFLRHVFNNHRFPRLINCQIDICAPYDRASHRSALRVTLPTDFPPQLESLTFTCDTSLALEGFDVVPETPLLKLRTVAFDVTRHHSDDAVALARWAGWLVRSLQTRGNWGTFQEFRLLARDCDADQADPQIDTVVPRDDLVAWCESNMKLGENRIICNRR